MYTILCIHILGLVNTFALLNLFKSRDVERDSLAQVLFT